MTIRKVLMNLETKLARLESVNEKLVDAYEQADDTEGVEQFQITLDSESEFIDGIITKISELKVLKEEVEKRRKDLEVSRDRDLEQRVTQMQEQVNQLKSSQSTASVANIWSQTSAQGPIKPPQLEIATFNGDVLRWQEFWDTFEAAIHNVRWIN